MATNPQATALTTAHQLTQARLAGLALIVTQELMKRILTEALTDREIATWLAAQANLQKRIHAVAVAEATNYLNLYREIETSTALAATMPIITPAFDPREAIAGAAWAPAWARKQATRGIKPADALNRVSLLVAQRQTTVALAPGRRLIEASAGANTRSHGWRRVGDANPCAWCAMLVARGPVYNDPAKAGDGRKFHNSCACTVEEFFGDTWQPTEAEQGYVDAFDRARTQPGKTVDNMRAQGGFRDSATGGRGGSGGKPPRSTTSAPSDPPEDDKAAWDRRQNSLPVNFHGERLDAPQIRSVERLINHGEEIEWIARDQLRSDGTLKKTSDFIWLNRDGKPYELKSLRDKTKITYSAIKDRIVKTWRNSHPEDDKKENFVFDVGQRPLPTKVIRQLEDINLKVESGSVNNLVILSENGSILAEINLRK